MRASRPALAMSIVGLALMGATMSAAEDRSADDHPVMVAAAPWRRSTASGARAATAIWCGSAQDGPSCSTSPASFAMRTSAVSATRTACSSSIDPWAATRSRSPRAGADPIRVRPGGGLAAGLHRTDAGTAPRIAALVAATFADLYPSLRARDRLEGANRGGLTHAHRQVERRRPVQDDPAMLAGSKIRMWSCRQRWPATQRNLEPGDGPTLSRVRGGNGGRARGRAGEMARAYERGILAPCCRARDTTPRMTACIWGRVGDIGYINFLSIVGFSSERDDALIDAALDQAIAAFKRRARRDRRHQQQSRRLGQPRPAYRRPLRRCAQLAYTKVAYGAQRRRAAAVLRRAVQARALPRAGLSAHQRRDAQRGRGVRALHAGAAERGPGRRRHPRRILRHDREAAAQRLDAVISAEVYRDPQGDPTRCADCRRSVKREVFPPSDLTGGHARAVLALMDEIRRDDAERNGRRRPSSLGPVARDGLRTVDRRLGGAHERRDDPLPGDGRGHLHRHRHR